MTDFSWASRCPVHDMPDCSPLLNGCSIVIRQMALLAEAERLRDGLTALVANPSIRRWIDDSELVDADDIRTLLAGGRKPVVEEDYDDMHLQMRGLS